MLAASIGSFFNCAAMGEPTAEISPAPSPSPQRLQNISARARVQTEQNVLIAGIIINGTTPKSVIIRALGPSLSVNGVPIVGTLADPTLELYVEGSDIPIAGNNDWRETQEREISQTKLAPTSNLEAAIVMTLDPGHYTAIVRGRNGGSGIGSIEAYDLTTDSTSKFANISTRGFAGLGDDALIGGLIVGGESSIDSTERVIVRGIGPSLSSRGVAGALPDPTLQLFDSNGTSLGFNDNWRDSQGAEIEESGLAPESEMEAAIIAVLPAGGYTAVLRGVNQTTGTALIEVYDAPIFLPLRSGIAQR